MPGSVFKHSDHLAPLDTAVLGKLADGPAMIDESLRFMGRDERPGKRSRSVWERQCPVPIHRKREQA